MIRFAAFTVLSALVLAVPTAAVAGPPCICWDLEVGDQDVLPINGWKPTTHWVPSIRVIPAALWSAMQALSAWAQRPAMARPLSGVPWSKSVTPPAQALVDTAARTKQRPVSANRRVVMFAASLSLSEVSELHEFPAAPRKAWVTS